MGRILAIDYGKRRTGLAVTDTLQIVAGGLRTIDTSELMKFLHTYIPTENVERVVVGYAKQTNGKESENMSRTRHFVSLFKKNFPDIPVEWYDERFTSVLAQRAILQSEMKKSKQKEKELVDAISATIILQDYLESKRGYSLD